MRQLNSTSTPLILASPSSSCAKRTNHAIDVTSPSIVTTAPPALPNHTRTRPLHLPSPH
ncbi:hypothetical protein B0H12DRAFT_1153190 [Mycena haematopus]|nr:hypothetical protein B0H12DRAFT_1153190 [Mycena haematopus]